MDVARLRAALTRLPDLLPQLNPDEQKHLAALCIERVEVCAQSGHCDQDHGRVLAIQLRLHAAQMVAGMEERVVVRVREARLAPIGKRLMVVDSAVRIGLANRPPEILAPFRETLGAARDVAPSKEPALRHPIHLAFAWRKKLAANPALSQDALARREQVSEATISRTLLMLKLIPDIQEILLKVRSRQEVRRYSLNRLLALAALPATAQQAGFQRLSG